MGRLVFALYIAAAVTTAISGILHLMLGPNSLGFNFNTGIFFIVAGIAQVFWIIPTLRRWGIPWYCIGIVGTMVLIAMYVITRMPDNPITGRGGPVNAMAILLEVLQAAFIGLVAVIIIYERRMKRLDRNSLIGATMNKTVALVFVGIVVALVLAGLFVPMLLHQGNGPPPGQFRGPPGQFGNPPQQSTTQGIRSNQTCTLTPSLIEVEDTPQQTEGPYFVDEMLDRYDIRSDPASGLVEEGIPLSLVIHVYDVDNGGSCIPLSGAQVDIWHANSQGQYSDIQQTGTGGKKYLRGYQVTDDNGTVRFTTIYPGWYEGRAIHIHVKVRTFEGAEKTFEWTSQFYLDNSINDQVHKQPPYSNHGNLEMTNEEDGIYTGASTDGMLQRNTGTHLMLNLSKDEQGFMGTFNIGVDANQSVQ